MILGLACLSLGDLVPAALGAAPTPAASVGVKGDGTEDPALEAQRELQNYESELKKVVDPINSINPFFTGLRPSPNPSGAPVSAMGENAAKAMQFVEQVRKWVEHPFVRSLLKALSDPKLSDALAKVWESPARPQLMYGQGISVLILWLLGMYRRGRALTFLKRLWVSVSQVGLSLIILGVVVPWATLGSPWLDLVGGVARALRNEAPALMRAASPSGITSPGP